jgi:hypothetical protein
MAQLLHLFGLGGPDSYYDVLKRAAWPKLDSSNELLDLSD